jgi:hypothetical protein
MESLCRCKVQWIPCTYMFVVIIGSLYCWFKSCSMSGLRPVCVCVLLIVMPMMNLSAHMPAIALSGAEPHKVQLLPDTRTKQAVHFHMSGCCFCPSAWRSTCVILSILHTRLGLGHLRKIQVFPLYGAAATISYILLTCSSWCNPAYKPVLVFCCLVLILAQLTTNSEPTCKISLSGCCQTTCSPFVGTFGPM